MEILPNGKNIMQAHFQKQIQQLVFQFNVIFSMNTNILNKSVLIPVKVIPWLIQSINGDGVKIHTKAWALFLGF